MTAKTTTKQKILLVLFGLFVCLVLLEIGLRIGGLVFLSLQEHRNKTALQQKDTYRILCLGESTTALGGRNSYPSQLENILNQQSPKIKFVVINGGIPGIKTTRIVAALEENLDRYHPDVVITMIGTNDGLDPISYDQISRIITPVFFKSLKVYKLAIFLRDHIAQRVSEILFEKIFEINFKNDAAYVVLAGYWERQEDIVKPGIFNS